MINFDDFDEKHYPRPDDTDFSGILDRAMSRRTLLQGTAAFGLAAFVTGKPTPAMAHKHAKMMSFASVAATEADTITLPEGYEWRVLVSWGDPLFSDGVPFDHKTRGTAESQLLAFGDNNDGMEFFPIDENNGVLAVNNEYVNRKIFSPNGIETAEEAQKGKHGHGVSVFNVTRKDGNWQVVVDGDQNRRITADTPMDITGPARGHDLLKTASDPTGTWSLGTWNNCGPGRTPWGTYLACEENFNGYFGSSDENVELTAEQQRYGIGKEDWGYHWYKHDARFDVSQEANECNRAGYVVEIDPMNPTSRPKKRTALGRMKHENAEVVIAENGKVVVYLGDDERGEFIYRFVSSGTYVEGDDDNNRDLLADGTLYVAYFGEATPELKGSGEWRELSPGKSGLSAENGFPTAAEIAVHSRVAGSIAGGTTMDRPEWVAAHPKKAEVYCALTNNKNRGVKPNNGGDETPVGGPNPREGNLYGQIVRWMPTGGDHTADTFDWDLFVLAGNPVVNQGLEAGSDNITADNMFNSPDGIAFDPDGRLWIQTDGNYKNKDGFAGMGNNQMLCGDTETGEIRRFLVGPKSCEITGATWSTDYKTMFIGVQHPGENDEYPSSFPGGPGSTPRSSIVAIWRKDQGVIGS